MEPKTRKLVVYQAENGKISFNEWLDGLKDPAAKKLKPIFKITGAMTMRKKAIEYNPFLYERLKNADYALAYLKEAMHDEDVRVFLMAIKNVADAKGMTMEELAQRCGVNRVTLYRILSRKGNPGFLNLCNIIQNLGYEFDIRLKA